MTKIKVLGGSVDQKLEWTLKNGYIHATGPSQSGWSTEIKKTYSLRTAKELDIADQASGVKVLGAVGWGTVGALVAGPLGIIVGGLLGGRGETVTFVAKFDDDETIMGQVPKKTWVQMLAAKM